MIRPATAEELARRLAKLDEAGRQRLVARHPELRCRARVRELCKASAANAGADLEQMDRLAGAAQWLAGVLKEPLPQALALRARANTAHFQGELEQAQDQYGEALALLEDAGEQQEAAITRSSALLNLAYLGDYDGARRWYEAARCAFEELGDRQRLAVLEHNLANVLYRRDSWSEALDLYRHAQSELEQLDRPLEAAICLRNVAVCLISLHRFDQALEAYRQTRAYANAHQLDRICLQADYNIAYLHYLRGEYMQALRLFQTVRRDCADQGDLYHQALCDLDLAEMYLELNLVDEAAELATNARQSFTVQQLTYEAAKAETFLALARSRLGDTQTALDGLVSARLAFSAEANLLWPALIDLYRAVVHYRRGELSAARPLAKQARSAFADPATAPKAALSALVLAEIELASGQAAAARQSTEDALRQLAGHDLPVLEHQAYRTLGEIEEIAAEYPRAIAAYQRSLELLERLQSQLHGEHLKIPFLSDKHAVYGNLVRLIAHDRKRVGRGRQVLKIIEQAKSRALTDLLWFRSHDLPSTSAAGDKLVVSLANRRAELSTIYHHLDRLQLASGAPALDQLRQLCDQARRCESALVDQQRQLLAIDQDLGSLQPGAPIDLEAIAGALGDDQLLVEYFIARDTLLAAVVDRRSIDIVELASAEKVRGVHRLLQLQLSKWPLGEARLRPNIPLIAAATSAHLGELYQALITPLAHLLEAGQQLIVAPHGFLHYVPFHALYDGHDHLIDHHSISYTPSASVFQLAARKSAAANQRSLVLGIADQQTPHILDEARAVASSLPHSTLLLGSEASSSALRQLGPGSRFVHIATHGLYRRDNPMFSAIQLGDGRLSLFDLYDLQLDAELVALSGCGTGLNTVLSGEELVGLTRGLLYAGAQSALVTLWDVHDASTADFMRRFYRHLGSGNERAAALRQAMLETREHQQHPYYWAPFALVGKPDGR